MSDLRDIFGAGGPLERALPGFRPRKEQARMAVEVAGALASRATLIVEAGTGTGKTFAYLVPALLSGARVLISTGTRALQDQLFTKDLPLVARALGRPARVSVLKGRANYLCHRRLSQAQTQLELGATTRSHRMLERVRHWATTTRSGDLAEMRGLSDSHPIWPTVTSTRDNCFGTRCEDFGRCHVVAARRAAFEADIVIVNHHLLLADLVLKEDGFGDILGSADALILDEAHQLPDLATQFLGASISSRRIEGLIRAVRAELDSAIPPSAAMREGARQILGCLRALESQIEGLQELLPRSPTRIAWSRAPVEFADAAAQLGEPLLDLEQALLGVGAESPLTQLGERAAELARSVERVVTAASTQGARAVEIMVRGFSITLLPFDISERFQALVSARQCAWIFTSATLSVGEDFGHFSTRLGLGNAAQLRIESPFDYERQSLLYLPAGLPDPSEADYVQAVIDTAVPLIDAAGGGAFILFTSHRALARGAELLRARWGAAPPYELYVQGEAPRERLLDDFRDNGNAVLLGTASFWEGVDVKGDALRLVVIEKLPFASPEDPLVKARMEHLQMQGANAFRDYQLPEAALALKQGVGRLIRSEEDFGAVVICDPRLLGRSYGRVLLDALPPMSITQDPDEASGFLRRHAPPRQAGHGARQRAC
jgi:ATP-dependent DNA helicase DinG